MLIEILRQTSIQGIPVRVGELVDASDADSRFLLAIGKANKAETYPADPEARKPRPRKLTPA